MGNGVILDTNCFSHVFKRSDKKHSEFAAFLEWLCNGPGYLVYGGTKYKEELSKANQYLKIFQLLHDCNKADVYEDSLIDNEMGRIVRLVNDKRFDDPHLAAIVVVTKSRVICTEDSRSFSYLKRKDIYDGMVECPKFYTGCNCSHLLTRSYVGGSRKAKKDSSKKLIQRIVD